MIKEKLIANQSRKDGRAGTKYRLNVPVAPVCSVFVSEKKVFIISLMMI